MIPRPWAISLVVTSPGGRPCRARARCCRVGPPLLRGVVAHRSAQTVPLPRRQHRSLDRRPPGPWATGASASLAQPAAHAAGTCWGCMGVPPCQARAGSPFLSHAWSICRSLYRGSPPPPGGRFCPNCGAFLGGRGSSRQPGLAADGGNAARMGSPPRGVCQAWRFQRVCALTRPPLTRAQGSSSAHRSCPAPSHSYIASGSNGSILLRQPAARSAACVR